MHANKDKMKYCYSLYRNLKYIDLSKIKKEIDQHRISNYSVMNLKKTLLCSVCDANEQKMFHSPKKMIIVEENFCKSLLQQHHKYIRFMHIEMISLMD